MSKTVPTNVTGASFKVSARVPMGSCRSVWVLMVLVGLMGCEI